MEIRSRAAAPARPAPRRRPALVLVLLAAVAALGSLGVTSLSHPRAVRATGPLPACRYDDLLTSPRGYDDWSTTLVDTILRVTRSYVPPDLVAIGDAGIAGRGRVRSIMIEDLRAMGEAAAAAGAAIGVQSAYRSYAEQKVVFDDWAARLGYQRALQVSARPGHSEHQLGLALDVRSEPGGSPFQGDWATTPAGAWMKAHAWEFGFVMSYPKRRMAVTCYDYEPWHYRYVGRDVAALIRQSGLTSRQYLWANFTKTIVPPATAKPRATPKPARTAGPSRTLPPTAPPSSAPTPGPAATPAAPTIPPVASASPVRTATPAPALTPTPGPPTQDPPAAASPLVLGGIGLAIGTIVLGGVLLMRGRGRSGAGL